MADSNSKDDVLRSLDELLVIVSSRQAQPHEHTESCSDATGSLDAPDRGLTVFTTDEDVLARAVEAAFRYRGDIDVTLDDGTEHHGYLFDRRLADPVHDSTARLLVPSGQGAGHDHRVTIRYGDIRRIVFSGRDAAAGKSWEHWVKKHGRREGGTDSTAGD